MDNEELKEETPTEEVLVEKPVIEETPEEEVVVEQESVDNDSEVK